MSEPVRILMIDDDEEDFMIVRDLVREIPDQKYIIDWTDDIDHCMLKIQEQQYDVYFVDYRMGKITGDELIRNAIQSGCKEPMILLTGQNSFETNDKALQAGAFDYLTKNNLNPNIIENTVRYSIAHANQLKEIANLNNELENRVKDRTEILQKAVAELEKTKKNLAEALVKEKDLNDLKSRFVAMASHEFRTPLATVLSSLSLIDKYGQINQYENQKKHIERIRSSVNNLTEIINDVLSLSNLEEGGVAVRKEVIAIESTIEEWIKDLQMIAKPGQEIIYKHHGNALIESDKKILKHILYNFISNAIKFSGENKQIIVTTEITQKNMKITVSDQGIGISETEISRLFDRFFRASNASNIQGTGLGLSIVSKYVEILDGSIQVDSKLNTGTTFTVTVPVNTID